MTDQWANRARSYYREYRPGEYRAIPNKETFFRELGEAAGWRRRRPSARCCSRARNRARRRGGSRWW
jgi:hypothetical protein